MPAPGLKPNLMKTAMSRVADEYNKQPITFVITLIGFVGLVVNALQSVIVTLIPTIALSVAGVSVVLKMAGFVLIQGILSSFLGRVHVWLSKRGHGMPMIFVAVASIVASWLSAFNGFWVVADESAAPALLIAAFVGSIFGAFVLNTYFSRHYFREYENAELLKRHLIIGVHVLPSIRRFFWWTLWSYGLSLILFAVHFGLLLPPLPTKVN